MGLTRRGSEQESPGEMLHARPLTRARKRELYYHESASQAQSEKPKQCSKYMTVSSILTDLRVFEAASGCPFAHSAGPNQQAPINRPELAPTGTSSSPTRPGCGSAASIGVA